MITITKNGNAVLFEFEENQHYLYNGTIEVPLNSLSLVTDESEMFTFKKAATNDIFISARYDDVNMSKSQLIDFYIANMVGSTGGGSESGITSGDVESMISASLEDYYDIDEIDAALSGKADSSAVTEAINAAVSGKADTSAVTEEISAAVSGKADTSAVTESINAAVSGKADTSAVTEEISAAVSGKADTSTVTEAINSAVSGKADSSSVYTKSEVDTALNAKADTATTYTKTETDNAITAATSTKQDTLVSGTNIKTINNESILGSGNIEIEGGGGGKAIEAGTNISVTTGETADTINCTLPITISNSDNGSKQSIAIGSGSSAHISNFYNSIAIGKNSKGYFGSIVIGSNPTAYTQGNGSNVAIGNGTKFYDNSIIIGNYAQGYNGFNANNVAIGVNARANNIKGAVAIGYDVYTDGTTKTNINNQIKIDSSNQVYIYNKDNTEMICLQDQLGGGGSSYSAGTGIDITNDVISVTGKVDTSAITTSITSSSTDSQVPSAKAVNDKLGGLSIVKLTQSEYDSLATKDNSTLYIVTDS